jgi:hypothetical protein
MARRGPSRDGSSQPSWWRSSANFPAATWLTIELMRGMSGVRAGITPARAELLPWWRLAAYGVLVPVSIAYLWPIVRWVPPAGDVVPTWIQRRVVSAPLVVAGLGFIGWVGSIVVFPVETLVRTGRWSPDLMSQQVLSPLVNGFLAATSIYLVVDLVFRSRVVPHVFPEGRLADVPGALALSVRGRLVVFLIAVGFVPLFTLFGLVRAAVVRLHAGLPIDAVVPQLAHASAVSFSVFLVLGIALTAVLARTFTQPLGAWPGRCGAFAAATWRLGWRSPPATRSGCSRTVSTRSRARCASASGFSARSGAWSIPPCVTGCSPATSSPVVRRERRPSCSRTCATSRAWRPAPPHPKWSRR